jgi:hypothetical protein
LTALPSPAAGSAEGERRRDHALRLLRERRAVLIRRVQRAFLALLLDRGPSTTDPVRTAVPIPAGTDPRLVGSAIRQLAELELIYRSGLSRSMRPEAHGRDLPLWAIADREGALAWLNLHHELPEPNPEPGEQLFLFDHPINQGTGAESAGFPGDTIR